MNKILGTITLLLFSCGADIESKDEAASDSSPQVVSAPGSEVPATTTTGPNSTTKEHRSSEPKAAPKSRTEDKQTPTAKPKPKNQITKETTHVDQSSNPLDNDESDVVIIPPTDDDDDGDDGDSDDSNDQAPIIPDFVEITALTYAGTGCSAGSATLDYLHDGKTFELNTNDLFAYADLDSSRRDRRRFCQVLVAIDYSAGWQFAIKQVQLEAHVEIEASTDAEAKISSYIQGDEETAATEFLFSGPTYDSFELSSASTDEVIWSPCHERRALNMKVEALVKGTTIDDTPLGIIEIGNPIVMELQWKPCTSDEGSNPNPVTH
jgi:hypothetical protein